MTQITAIEVENFQSIEQRTRIELKPITLLFGPNSAGKSAIFDAIDLITALLDPIQFNAESVRKMIERWARGDGDKKKRKTFLSIEFPFEFIEFYEVWGEDSNWPETIIRTQHPNFYWDSGDTVEYNKLEGATIRIELHLEIQNRFDQPEAYMSECQISLKDMPLLRIQKTGTTYSSQDESNEAEDTSQRELVIYQALRDGCQDRSENFDSIPIERVLRPLAIAKWSSSDDLGDDPKNLCKIASDAFFYFGTILFRSSRNKPGIVPSDRRAPRPNEALAVVDLGLRGWWSRSSFSASSPAALLKSISKDIDQHYQGLAESAHAELIVRTASSEFWGDSHAEKHIGPIKSKGLILDRVNHHLEKNLFTEKLYKLAYAVTLMVPIDLEEDDPWSYYALAQPAAVRLFLQDGDGQKIDFQDVGSGIPYVLPILYAAVCQGFVKVQQPELHLHPALQASLADVFIEELNRPGSEQFLIETHSEHLLLRFLRRIRDNENGKSLSKELVLTNKELAVYYFDPKVTGGTIVTRQLVTPLGDFYTDWPRGFFPERNRDLFDE
jgi:AAA15 family ATPase/GTPase